MTYHEEYDPDLHGVPEQTPPHAQRGMAIAWVLALIGLPFVVILALS